MAPSHHAAAAKRRASDHGAPVSWKAKGSPLGASPVGSEIDGMPAELHGAQKEASPVKARPLGAVPGAVGDTSASKREATAAMSARKARRGAWAGRESTAFTVLPSLTRWPRC